MKYKLYYHAERDLLGINTKSNLLQFSNEANFFMSITGEWEFISEIEFKNPEVEKLSEIVITNSKIVIANKVIDIDDFEEQDAVISWN